MNKKIVLAIFLFIFPLSSYAANERVTDVYSCGPNIGLKIENIGWVVALESEIGEKRVDRILSMGLMLLATQNPIGFINPQPLDRWCGINDVQRITVLRVTRP